MQCSRPAWAHVSACPCVRTFTCHGCCRTGSGNKQSWSYLGLRLRLRLPAPTWLLLLLPRLAVVEAACVAASSAARHAVAMMLQGLPCHQALVLPAAVSWCQLQTTATRHGERCRGRVSRAVPAGRCTRCAGMLVLHRHPYGRFTPVPFTPH